MPADRSFVDTNLLVYAYDVDAGEKHDVAKQLLLQLWSDDAGAVSTQVLQEFYVTVTRKLSKPLGKRAAREVIGTYEAWDPFRPTVDDILAASQLEERHRLGFWDALVIVAAERSRCTMLLSEDLQHGRDFGTVRVHNPLRS